MAKAKQRKTAKARPAKTRTIRKPVKKAKAAPKAKAATKAKATAKAKKPAAAPAPGEKHQFLNAFRREHATTMKVMKAFPADKHAFQPHARSSSAKRLMWTFAVEQALIGAALEGALKMPLTFPPEPETLGEVLEAFEAGGRGLIEKIERAPESRLMGTAPFFTGPGQVGDVRVGDLMWMMLMDSIHHRGQLSVYVRMAGGLVPSIYGPSADEPW